MLSNFAFIKDNFNLVFLVFALVKQNYFYKNLWLATKRNGVCGGTLVLLCILQQKKHKKILNLGALRHWKKAFPHDHERRTWDKRHLEKKKKIVNCHKKK